MNEPCAHKRSDALTSFVGAIKDLTKAQSALTRIKILCDNADACGQDVSVPVIREAMKGPQ